MGEPAVAGRLEFLIDTCNESLSYAVATDPVKVALNLEQLDPDFFETVQRKASDCGFMLVFTAGKYIVILDAGKSLSRISMEFFDFSADRDFRDMNDTVLDNFFPEEVVLEFEELRDQLECSYVEGEAATVGFALVG